jgi:arsenate reductase
LAVAEGEQHPPLRITDPSTPLAGSVRIYSYAPCTTCRKALAWLQDHGISADVRDISQIPPSRQDLEEALRQLGSRSRLFNTSGQRYRALGAERVAAMDDGAALEALASDGMLIKRPFLITAQGRIVTGFRPQEWQNLLKPSVAG